MKRLLREPFLHFVLLGVLVFAVDAFLRARTAQAGGGDIVVTEGRIENLAALFARTWQRPPAAGELRALVDEYVLEEALFREGVALGVDQGDTVIRRADPAWPMVASSVTTLAEVRRLARTWGRILVNRLDPLAEL